MTAAAPTPAPILTRRRPGLTQSCPDVTSGPGRDHRGRGKPVRYADAGGPNQVVSASASPSSVRSPTQATYPSGLTNTAVGAATTPIAGSSHAPPYPALISWTRSAHGVMSRPPG